MNYYELLHISSRQTGRTYAMLLGLVEETKPGNNRKGVFVTHNLDFATYCQGQIVQLRKEKNHKFDDAEPIRCITVEQAVRGQLRGLADVTVLYDHVVVEDIIREHDSFRRKLDKAKDILQRVASCVTDAVHQFKDLL